jgi:hypothetical protein
MLKQPPIARTKWACSQLETYIKKEAQNSVSVIFTDHIKKQMKARKITNVVVMAVLQRGSIKRTPEPNAMRGSLECRMEYFVAGFNIGVVVAVCDEDPSLILVTAMHI